MEILHKLYRYFVVIPEYKEIFSHFDVDKDGKLSEIELANLFDAVRQKKEDKGTEILLRIGAVDSNINSDFPLSLSQFLRILKAREPVDQLWMHFAILLGTYKQPRKDRSDLGSLTKVQAQSMMNTYLDETLGHTVIETVKGMVDKNPDAGERKDGIIRFEHFFEVVLALCVPQKAECDEECTCE